ncbi:MAG: hypothetical protein GX100_00295, partial [candidate division WS1 bacterium]|nr:hypothetical protein [candidate division WS1 bacterium]
MMRGAVSVALSLLVLAVGSGGAVLRAEEPEQEPRPPEMSVWLRFEEPTRLDRSSSLDSWPMECADGALAPGRHGQALALPGRRGNGLHLPRPTAFFGTQAQAGTLALWVRPENPEADFVIADLYRRAGNTRIDGNQIVIHSAGGKLIAGPCLSRWMRIDTPLKTDTWTHLALTWDSTQGTQLFVDGEKRGEIAAGFDPVTLEEDWPGRIGGPTGAGAPFAGMLDEVRLWNRRLSEEELRAVYESSGPAAVPVTMEVGGGAVTVRNGGKEEAVVDLGAWAPGASQPPPYWGWSSLPLGARDPEHRMCIVGPVPGQVLRQVSVPAGGSQRVALGGEAERRGPLHLKLLAGEGVARGAVAVREYDGVTVRPTGCGMLVLREAPQVELNLTLRNGSPESFSDRLELRLSDSDGRALGESTLTPRLKPGGEQQSRVVFRCKAPPGKYLLTAREVTGGAQLEQFPVYVTSDVDASRVPGITASLHGRVTAAVLDRAVADGVDGVPIGRVSTYHIFQQDADLVLSRGRKLLIMSSRYYPDVCLNPERRVEMRQYARNLGRLLATNPAVIMVTIAGEAASAPTCYCEHCTAGFQDWLRQEYGSLEAMNAAWGAKYRDWSEVQQLGSPEDLDARAESLQLMRIDLALPADHTKRWRALFEMDKGRAMAWRKWQDAKLIGFYADFQEAYRGDHKWTPPAGEQPCWANMNSQNLFAAARVNDIGGQDLYLPGTGPTTLGYPAELFLNFDMNQRAFHAEGKPVALNELYIQDNSPAGEAEAQGWWLTGRGYGNLNYFTYDYYYEGVRNKLPLIFGMFDKEGQPYPAHPSFQRFCRDLRTFRNLPGIERLRRERAQVALFMGDDVSRASALETAGATWDAAGVHGHNGAYWLTERAGFAVDFLNDDRFDWLAGKRALIVPWAHVIRPQSIERIVDFARRGGTVILDGPVGLYSEHYQPYAVLPGGETLSSALGMTFDGYEDRPNRLILDPETGPTAHSAWYRFDSEQTLGQSVGQTREDTVQKATAGEGKVGGGLVLPGEGGNGLYLADPAGFFGEQAERGTVAVWVKPEFDPAADKSARVIIDLMKKSGNSAIDGHEAVIYAVGDQLVASPALTIFRMEHPNPLRRGEWTHLAMTWDSRIGAALYVNGERVQERQGAFRPVELQADWPGRLGCMSSVGGAPFAGVLDELRLFNYALSPEEVMKLPADSDPSNPQLAVRSHLGVAIASRGTPVNLKLTKGEVLFKDSYGNPAVVEVPVGRGRMVACLTNLGRSHIGNYPDPNAVAWWKSLLQEKAGLQERYRFVPAASVADAEGEGGTGPRALF